MKLSAIVGRLRGLAGRHAPSAHPRAGHAPARPSTPPLPPRPPVSPPPSEPPPSTPPVSEQPAVSSAPDPEAEARRGRDAERRHESARLTGEQRRADIARWRRCRALGRESLWAYRIAAAGGKREVVVRLGPGRRVAARQLRRVSLNGELPLRWTPEAAAEIRLRVDLEPEEWWAIVIGEDPRLQVPDIAADLAEAVANGEFRPGARLPSMADLAGLYGVARGTIRKAVARLEADGVVRVEPGRGTFAAAPTGTAPRTGANTRE